MADSTLEYMLSTGTVDDFFLALQGCECQLLLADGSRAHLVLDIGLNPEIADVYWTDVLAADASHPATTLVVAPDGGLVVTITDSAGVARAVVAQPAIDDVQASPGRLVLLCSLTLHIGAVTRTLQGLEVVHASPPVQRLDRTMHDPVYVDVTGSWLTVTGRPSKLAPAPAATSVRWELRYHHADGRERECTTHYLVHAPGDPTTPAGTGAAIPLEPFSSQYDLRRLRPGLASVTLKGADGGVLHDPVYFDTRVPNSLTGVYNAAIPLVRTASALVARVQLVTSTRLRLDVTVDAPGRVVVVRETGEDLAAADVADAVSFHFADPRLAAADASDAGDNDQWVRFVRPGYCTVVHTTPTDSHAVQVFLG